MEAIIGGKQVFYEEVSNNFNNEDTTSCPYCLQPVTSEYKSALIASIHKVLSKVVDLHKSKLKALKMNKINFDKNIYRTLNKNVVDKCDTLVININLDIELYNSLIDRKFDNVYTPIHQEILGISERIAVANIALGELETLRKTHNEAILQKDKIFNSLIKLNKELFRYVIEENHNQYILLKKQKLEVEILLSSLATEKQKIQSELNQLLQQKKSIKIAVEHINKGIQYVFFSPNRFELRAEDDEYKLYSNGYPVKPSDISCGERNIIALCYFFTQMMDNLDEVDMYTRESLLVIDDPVSSLDFENRIGILSYLKSQVLRIMFGNRHSKLILFTHDLSSFFDIEKMAEEIKESCEKKYGKHSTDFHLHELQNKALKDFRYKKRNEYTLLLESIYRYGVEETAEDEIVIVIRLLNKKAC
ncbi:wobble nucleotide-excising tRNase [Anaerosolibacter carboniphilus]|uniref:Wobble nucleotide-excising tRNase n=1 Tax=Anaerosolibacter carboniphilus TaxID=1417629 RepID=A0A841KX20_9FIRM|nr:AAA family ATPase [Anaerosolibacter carboniphilus]MBB6217907.1 wobble nucleotide-excising tRNase [Anaerosolibacter carboniphilus]